MKIYLRRKHLGETFTEGRLYIDDVFECFTVEDKDRKLEEHGCSAKVQNKTCIPRGEYELIIRYSNHFKKHLIAVTGVPCFEGILIHSGNSSKDTEGCIIVGSVNDRNDDDWVGGSRVAYDRLHKKVKSALSMGEKVFLVVS